jgi:hypothetical protein
MKEKSLLIVINSMRIVAKTLNWLVFNVFITILMKENIFTTLQQTTLLVHNTENSDNK